MLCSSIHVNSVSFDVCYTWTSQLNLVNARTLAMLVTHSMELPWTGSQHKMRK